MQLRNTIYVIFYLLMFGSCIFDFDPPSKGFENLLVVEAFLSNDDELFEVVLSRSIPIDTNGLVPEEYASISVSDNLGELFNLYEASPGRYIGSWDLKAQIGRIYQLHIQTKDGNQYESEAVVLKETPPIDSVFFEYEERFSIDNQPDIKGLQIYLTTHDPSNKTWFYRWNFKESWEFRANYKSLHIWEDEMVKDRLDQIYNCWKYNESSAVLISTSNNLNEDIINEFPIVYISNATDRLESKYSILVKQYALSEESFNYWNELEKINENLGTMFDPQPSVIEGNIYNINDENDIVLGYFDASSVREKRLFISKGEFPSITTPNVYSGCIDTIASYRQIPALINLGYMLVGEVGTEGGGVAYQLSYEYCIDCTLYGTNVEPGYWE